MNFQFRDPLEQLRPAIEAAQAAGIQFGFVSGGVMTPHYQCSYDEAAAAVAAGRGDGVGFVFTPEDDFFFVDVDSCSIVTPAGGAWSPLALEILATFAGAGVEVSQSGHGLHVIGRGTPPPHSCKNVVLGIELYHENRFVALTGKDTLGNVNTDHTAALATIVAKYFPPNPHGEVAGW